MNCIESLKFETHVKHERLKGLVYFFLLIAPFLGWAERVSFAVDKNLSAQDTIIDAQFTREQVFSGKEIPAAVIRSQELITVFYWGFDDTIHQGQLVCAKEVAKPLKQVFEQLLKIKFPIHSVIPVHAFNWSDEASMQANNTSSFNYRKTANGGFSAHSQGLAIDINPLLNPFVSSKGRVAPAGATYNPEVKGTVAQGSEVIRIFNQIGWKWGGNWKSAKDYQHFSRDGR